MTFVRYDRVCHAVGNEALSQDGSTILYKITRQGMGQGREFCGTLPLLLIFQR